MSRPSRKRGPLHIAFFIVGPIAFVVAIVLFLFPQVHGYFIQDDDEPGGYLDQTNAVLGTDDACSSFGVRELAVLIGIDAEPSSVHESSPTEYDEAYETLDKVSCSLVYPLTGCPPEQAGVDQPQARIDVDVHPNPSEAFTAEGYATFKEDYGGEEDRYDTHFASLGSPWSKGEVFVSERLPGRAAAAIALADFYRVEIGIEMDGAECSPSEQDIAALLSDEYLPSLHASIEERADRVQD
jgi:hypothetical protein